MKKEEIEKINYESVKDRDSRNVEKIMRIAEKDPSLALKYVEKLRDVESKIYGLVNIYNLTGDENLLFEACKLAGGDEEKLKIVEYTKTHHPVIDEIAAMIESGYRRDVAFSILLERTGDLNYAYHISDSRMLSASLKRLSERKMYPENLRIARMIPDPYYRCLALLRICEIHPEMEKALRLEILDESLRIGSRYQRRKVLENLERIEKGREKGGEKGRNQKKGVG